MNISVVIPTHKGRSPDLELCLDSIRTAKERALDDVEVMVVDGGCENLDSMMDKHQYVRLIKNGFKYSSAARNKGISEAKYDVIALTDSDCIVDPNWLRNISRWFDTHDDVALQGVPWEFMSRKNKNISAHDALFYEIIFRSRYVRGDSVTNVDTRNLAIRRDKIVDALPLFDDTHYIAAAEDRISGTRLRKAGNIGWDESIKIFHKDLSFLENMNRYMRYGKGRKYYNYKTDLKDVSRLNTYISRPIENGVPIWYVLAANASFVVGFILEKFKK